MDNELLVIEKIFNEVIVKHEKFMEEMVSSVVNYVENECKNDLISKMDLNYSQFLLCSRKLNIKNDRKMQEAYRLGFIKAIMDIKKQKDKFLIEKVESNKYYIEDEVLNKIVEQLYHGDMLSGHIISKLLKISEEEIEDKLLLLKNKKLIGDKIYGEVNYFYLTSLGKNYFKNLCNKYNEKISTDQYTYFLIDILDTIYDVLETPTMDKKIRVLNLYESPNIMHLTKPKLFNEKLNRIINKIDYVNENNFIDSPTQLDDKITFELENIMFTCR
jgi:hypothetical protein